MPTFRCLDLPVAGAQSLTWDGDVLMDWLNTGDAYGLDGSRTSGRVSYGYRFDSVATSPSGEYTALYERLGTKGIILRGGKLLREIDRSYYCAAAYDFPIALFRLPDGREAIAHCPDRYNLLEFDLLETGERLSQREKGDSEPADVFHSGLTVSPTGTWLMSAGWWWHPFCEVSFYPVADVLREPSALDRPNAALTRCAEIESAVFIDENHAVLASNPDADEPSEDDDPDTQLHRAMIGVYRPGTREWASRAALDEPAGVMLAVGAEYVLALFKHPKLIHLATGQIVKRWPDIPSGAWKGCISASAGDIPPTAWDPIGKRLAVATADRIHVLLMT